MLCGTTVDRSKRRERTPQCGSVTAFHCVGTHALIDGKYSVSAYCEGIDKDGDKILTRNTKEGPRGKQEVVAGTGKYEGMVRSGITEPLGQFPSIKPGTFTACNRQTGTYKMKEPSALRQLMKWLPSEVRTHGDHIGQKQGAEVTHCGGVPGITGRPADKKIAFESPILGPTIAAAALCSPGSGRRQVPPRHRRPPAQRGRRLHVLPWRPDRWRHRPSLRWTRSPAGASGR